MDDLTVKAGYSPGGAGGEGATSFHIGYAGVEGLSLDYAVGDTNTIGSEQEHTTMKASYAYSSFTLSYSNTESEYDSASGTQKDEEVESWNLAYTVSDDLSVSYGTETISTDGSSIDEEAEKINVSYTTGGVTLSASQFEFTGQGNSNTDGVTTGDKERWALSATFAF